jgi:hypothetical protein
MRLVIRYSIGDECSWNATETVPVEYESAEAFAVEFAAFCRANHKRGYSHHMAEFAGQQWCPDNFFLGRANDYYPPEILTVDEWFAEY